MTRYLLCLEKDKTFSASIEFQTTCLVLLLKTILKLKLFNFLSCVAKDGKDGYGLKLKKSCANFCTF